eukprot:g9586.t1
MKYGLLSLALMGTPTSGCWLRSSVDGRRTQVEGSSWVQQALMKASPVPALPERDAPEPLFARNDKARVAREKRIAGKKALSEACSHDAHFYECSQDKGSAMVLERCLKAKQRGGMNKHDKLSASCRAGLKAWKQLLADTAADARNGGKWHGPGSKKAAKKAAKKAFPRAARVQESKEQVAAEQHTKGAPRIETWPDNEGDVIIWVDADADPVEIDVFDDLGLTAAGPAHHHPHPHPHPHHHHHDHSGRGHGGRHPDDHFHFHPPHGLFVDEDEIFSREERRPSMFSVLADWIFGDSSESWDPSPSFEDQGVSTFTAIGTSSGVDAGFFPAGYGFPLVANAFEEPQPSQPPNNLRPFNKRMERLFAKSFPPPVVDLAELDWGVSSSEGMTEKGFDPLSAEVPVQDEPWSSEDVTWAANEEEVEFLNNEALKNELLRRSKANRVGGHAMEPEWAKMREEDLPMFAGGPRVHPKHHHRGDHIRFRNPLPEDFENQGWLSDSFDVDGDGPDLVEAILAFFFFIGAMTLMLLPFFLLARALKRMVRNGGGGGGGGDDADAPDGYYALLEDAESASASASAARMAAAEEDDSIVVTGTPSVAPAETKSNAHANSLRPLKTAFGIRNGKEHPKRGTASQPLSFGDGDGCAEDMDDPFIMALLRSRQDSPVKADGAEEGQVACRKSGMVTAGALSEVDDAAAGKQSHEVVVSSGKTPSAKREASADILPPAPTTMNQTSPPQEITRAKTPARTKFFDAVEGTWKPRNPGEQLDTARSKQGSGGGNDCLLDAPYSARTPAKPRSDPTPFYARGTLAGARGVCSRRRKSRGKDGGVPKSTGHHATDSLLRLCPALEARISDLRRDNTAAARFLNKAQVAAWHKARRPAGVLVSRNRAVCALEGAELSLMRRDEMATRARCRREANLERKKRLERRRQKEAEATRIKHEGPSLAEVKAFEHAVLLEKRQRFFLATVAAITSVMRWRNEWKERKWKLAKFAEALASVSEEKASRDAFEASVERVQRFFRRRQGGGLAEIADARGKPNAIRCLKKWIPSAHTRWKRRRREGGITICDFLKDARLSQNLKAIYRFRRKVMRCQAYVRGVFLVTRARLILLDLFFRRCEARLRGRLAERVRQQVHEEAAADLTVHRQLMGPSSGAPGRGAAVTADIFSDATGGRPGRQKRGGGVCRGSGDGVEDDVGELMETVAALRLKSALEELEKRSARPDTKRRLLEDLLVKVRAAHQANMQLSSMGGAGKAGRCGAVKGGKTARGRRGVSLPEALFTVDDARELLTRSPPPPQSRGLTNEADIADGRQTMGLQASPNNAAGSGGGLTDAPFSTPRTMLGDGRNRHTSSKVDIGSKTNLRTNTRVPTMLLLKGVPEAVMCQLVLAGWEESSCVGGGATSNG